MLNCHECHKEIKKGEPFCTFYAFLFHLPCFVYEYVPKHLKKKEWKDEEADVNEERTGDKVV